MKIVLIGERLPGRSFSDGRGTSVDNVHVGVQVGRDPVGLVAGDAPSARWEIDVREVIDDSGGADYRGPAVQGPREARFIYLTWGNVTKSGAFEMFRRAKLMFDDIDPGLVDAARSRRRSLVATVALTDECGAPRCARVRSPHIVWSLGA